MKSKIIWYAVPLFLLSGYIFYQQKQIDTLKEESQLQAVELSTLKDSVLIYRNKIGQLTFKISTVEVDHKNAKKALEASGYDIKELKSRDIKWQKVVSTLTIELQAKQVGEVELKESIEVNENDTTKTKIFNWDNGYASLFGTIKNDRMSFQHGYQTGINFVTETMRNGTLVSVFLTDTTAVITTGNSVFIKPKTYFWQKPWPWAAAGIVAGYFIAK